MEEELRITLAVKAHIRHTHTKYDSILSEKRTRDPDDRQRARNLVHHEVETIAAVWRKEIDNDKVTSSKASKPSATGSIDTGSAGNVWANRLRRRGSAKSPSESKMAESPNPAKKSVTVGLQLSSGSEGRLGQYQRLRQRRRAAAKEKKRLNSTQPLGDKRMGEVQESHRPDAVNRGGKSSCLSKKSKKGNLKPER